VRQIDWRPLTAESVTYDLMSGMGECWNLVMQQSDTQLTGVDERRRAEPENATFARATREGLR